MPSTDGIAGSIMAVPAHICMYIVDMLIAVYNFFARLTLKFEPQPPPSASDRRRNRRGGPSKLMCFARRVVHFILQLIELPVFLVVFILTALILSLLAVVEIVLGALFIKFRLISLVALLLVGGYWLYEKGYIKNPLK